MATRKSSTYDRDREYRLLRTYGITIAQYEEIKAVQGGVCPLCLRAKGISAPLQVDHDHNLEVDGRAVPSSVRGLLDGRCNNRLGWLEAKFDRVMDYLQNPPARKVL